MCERGAATRVLTDISKSELTDINVRHSNSSLFHIFLMQCCYQPARIARRGLENFYFANEI